MPKVSRRTKDWEEGVGAGPQTERAPGAGSGCSEHSLFSWNQNLLLKFTAHFFRSPSPEIPTKPGIVPSSQNRTLGLGAYSLAATFLASGIAAKRRSIWRLRVRGLTPA